MTNAQRDYFVTKSGFMKVLEVRNRKHMIVTYELPACSEKMIKNFADKERADAAFELDREMQS